MNGELTFSCPVCGADVPRKAKSCPECGACERSGWSEDRYLDGLDLPDDEPASPRRPADAFWVWRVVGTLLLLALLWLMLRGVW